MKIYFESLGCDKNLADSEQILGMLETEGYEIVQDEDEADIAIVNSCCFILDAKQESIEALIRLAGLKNTGSLRYLLVCGCLAQRYKDEILQEIPEVDAVIGTTAYEELVNILNKLVQGERCVELKPLDYLPKDEYKRMITAQSFVSYLKIAEGCDKRCSYCIIPSLKGRYRSVPMERLISQAEYLASNGCVELILVAQETTLYGKDLYGRKSLPKLLSELSKIEGIHWIRIMYCYPEEIDEELIAAVRDIPKVLHYLDMPVQHANDRILKKMGRRTTEKELKELIGRLRTEIPDIALRTTFITGFPSETDEEFEELLDFVYDMEFDRTGAFPYSAEEGTPAASFDGQIDEDVRESRRDALMELAADIAFDKAAGMTGRVLEVIVDGYLPEEDVYAARSYMDAPSVDSCVFVKAERPHVSGEFITVKIEESDGYDLKAVEVL